MKESNLLQKDSERGETTELVYNLLKEMIFGWNLSPGQKINISNLAKEMNVSTIPMREALSRLHSEKLVMFEPNKGYRVSDILDNSLMTDMFKARILMETDAVRNIIRSNNLLITEDLSLLTDEMVRINTASSNRGVLNFVNLDQQFHQLLMKAGGNTFLANAYEGMHCHLHIARFYHVRGEVDQSDATSEHREIIEAIKMRDIYQAEFVVTKHIQDVRKRILELAEDSQM
jgi:DNA-binding GntR family transcriptional regulator